MLLFESRTPNLLSHPKTPEVIVLGVLQSPYTVLQCGSVHFPEPFRFRIRFQKRQLSALLRIRQILFLTKRSVSFVQEAVEDIAAASERLFDQILLLPVRIQDPLEGLIDRILRSVCPLPLHLFVQTIRIS